MSAADRLAHAGAWPETAAALAGAGDPAVLADLVAAYDQPVEASRGDLLDAMDALGGAAPRRAASPASADADERRVAARLMHLLPDREHLGALEPLAEDDDAAVADGGPQGPARAARARRSGTPRSSGWRRATTPTSPPRRRAGWRRAS